MLIADEADRAGLLDLDEGERKNRARTRLSAFNGQQSAISSQLSAKTMS